MGSTLDAVYDRTARVVNRTAGLNSRPFDPATSMRTPHGRWRIVHYGAMVPALPEPLRFLDFIVILGSARVPVFDNRTLLEGPADDTAWVLTGSGLLTDTFRPYSITRECELASDGSDLRFGDELAVRHDDGAIEVRIDRPVGGAALTLRPTEVVSHFAHLPGVYDHWSLLCEYEGSFDTGGESIRCAGLCTFEYARAADVPLPFVFFTYQVLNIDERTQVLMVEVIGRWGVVVQRTVYVRSLDGDHATYTRGFVNRVHTQADQPLVTPDGVTMTMPSRFSWSVQDDDGEELIHIDGTANGDFVYGMAAGYAGSYRYTGSFRGDPVAGTGYIEWIDRR